MSNQSRRLSLPWSVVVLGSVVIAACGGTARVDGSSTSAGAAGQGAVAGSASRCETVDCSDIECASGQVRVRRVGDCCDTCADGGASSVGGSSSVGGALGVSGAATAGSADVPDCSGVSCAVDCAPDEFYETVPGTCCPQCRPQTPECKNGRAGYQQLFSALIQQAGATSCNKDADCTVLPNFPKCGDSCSTTAVSVAAQTEIAAQLSDWEESNCTTCKAIYLPCVAPPMPICVGGTCLSYQPF